MLLHAFAGEVMRGPEDPGAARADRNQLLHRAGAGRGVAAIAMSTRWPKAASRRPASLRRREGPRRVPDPVGDRARQAARLSRQRQHQPEAAGGDQGDGRLLPPRQRQHPSRDASAERARDRAVRRRAQEGGGVPQRRRSAHDRADQGHDRRHQPRGAELRPDVPEGRRRGPAVVAGAPLEHRAVAARCGADRRGDQGRADQRRRRARSWTNTRGCCRRARRSSRSATSRTRSARSIRSSR